MTTSGYAAYGQTHRHNLKGRQLEAEAFVKASRLLAQAQQNTANRRALQQALDYTRKLWMIVQADMSETPHPLPEKTRSGLLSLSRFVNSKCLDIATRNDVNGIDVLIDINQDIARGLMGRD